MESLLEALVGVRAAVAVPLSLSSDRLLLIEGDAVSVFAVVPIRAQAAGGVAPLRHVNGGAGDERLGRHDSHRIAEVHALPPSTAGSAAYFGRSATNHLDIKSPQHLGGGHRTVTKCTGALWLCHSFVIVGEDGGGIAQPTPR